MRCKQCDYALWNLRTRACPECGTPFAPSEYEFAANSVQFLCPHCEQAYYGTGVGGLPEPAAFNCAQCGQFVQLDEMVLRPRPDLTDEQTYPDRQPWLERAKTGRLRGWFSTVGLSMSMPGRLLRATPVTSGPGQAIWFFLVTHLVAMVLSGTGLAALAFLAIAGAPPADMLLPVVVSFMITVAMLLVGLMIWAGLAHLLLIMGGRPAHGFSRTLTAVAYASGPTILAALPCLLFHVYWVGLTRWSVCAVLAVMTAQRVSGLRASFAVITPPVVGTAVLIAAYVAMIISITSSFSATGPMLTAPPNVSPVSYALLNYARNHGGHGPTHAVELITDRAQALTPYEVLNQFSQPAAHSIPLGTTTIDAFWMMSDADQQRVAQALIAGMPADVVAHRVGDCVFVYHGIDLTNPPDPRLWTVVMFPAQLTPGGGPGMAAAQQTVLSVAFADGSTGMLFRPLNIELQQQNALRAAHGLPPLPDLSQVQHNQPATAAQTPQVQPAQPAP